jgi:hypothetical protein
MSQTGKLQGCSGKCEPHYQPVSPLTAIDDSRRARQGGSRAQTSYSTARCSPAFDDGHKFPSTGVQTRAVDPR